MYPSFGSRRSGFAVSWRGIQEFLDTSSGGGVARVFHTRDIRARCVIEAAAIHLIRMLTLFNRTHY